MDTLKRLVKILWDIPLWVKGITAFAVAVWLVNLAKQVEPYIYPVVTDFTIEEVHHDKGKTLIAGSLIKKRDCQFKEVIAVSDGHIVSIEFQETAYNTTGVVSRPVGAYDWGWWAVIPRISTLQLYSRHICNTGEVLTNLWEGKL